MPHTQRSTRHAATRAATRAAQTRHAKKRSTRRATLHVTPHVTTSDSDSDSSSDSSLFSSDEEDDVFDMDGQETSSSEDEEMEAYMLLHKQAGAQLLTKAEQVRVRELRDKYGFDRWQIMKDYTIYLPLHTIHTDEYEAFARKFLPNTIAGQIGRAHV